MTRRRTAAWSARQEVALADMRAARAAWRKGRLAYIAVAGEHLDIPSTEAGWDVLERLFCRTQLAAEVPHP